MGDEAEDHLKDERFDTLANLDALARDHGHVILDLAFAWLLSHDQVASVIAGASTPAQIVAKSRQRSGA